MVLRCRNAVLERRNRAMTLFAAILITALSQACTQAIASPPDEKAADKASSPTAESAEPTRVAPLSLAYVPRDAYLLMAFRPHAILKTDAFAPLNEFLAGHKQLKRHVGIPFVQIEQITLIQISSAEDSLASVFHLHRSEDVAPLTKALQPDPEERVYAGRKYISGKADSANQNCVFTDNQIVVATEKEEDLRRLLVAGRDGASKTRWAQEWHAESDADAFVFANVKALRSRDLLEGNIFQRAFMMIGTPGELNFILDASTVSMTVRLADKVHVVLRRDARNHEDALQNCDSLKSVVELFQVMLSTQRVDASKDATDQGAELLSLIDQVDALFDTITIQGNERSVTASAAVTLQDVARIVKAAIAVSATD